MPEHPIWKALSVAVYGMISLAAMWVFATEMDETEAKSLMVIVSSGAIYEFGIRRRP